MKHKNKRRNNQLEMVWDSREVGNMYTNPDISLAISRAAMVAKNHSLYIYGGIDTSNETTNNFYKYDVDKGEIKTLSKAISMEQYAYAATTQPMVISGAEQKMPAVSNHAMVLVESTYVGDIIYLFGGKIIKNKTETLTNEFYRYTIDQNKWEKIIVTGVIPTPRHSHTCTLGPDGKKIYIFGGTNDEKVFSDVYIFNIETKHCHKSTHSGDAPKGTVGHTAQLFEDHIYMFGGRDESNWYNDIYKMDVSTMEFEQIHVKSGSKPRSLHKHGATIVGNEMIVYGGIGKKLCNHVWKFDFNNLEWKVADEANPDSKPVTDADVANGLNLTGHSMSAIGRYIYIVGGEIDNQVGNGFIYTLDTKIRVLMPIENIPSTLSDDLSSLINDKFTSDVMLELSDGSAFFIHKFIMRIRCKVLYKLCAKVDHEIHLQEALKGLHFSSKKLENSPFQYFTEESIPVITLNQLNIIMFSIYTGLFPRTTGLSSVDISNIKWAAWVLELDRLYQYLDGDSEMAPPTLRKDLLNLYHGVEAYYHDLKLVNEETLKKEEQDRMLKLQNETLKLDASQNFGVFQEMDFPSPVTSLESPMSGDNCPFNDFAPHSENTFSSLDSEETVPEQSNSYNSSTFSHANSSEYFGPESLKIDIKFKVAGEMFPAHSALLIARSTYFKQLLFAHKKNCRYKKKESEIEIIGVSPSVFQKIIEFLYLDDVKISYDKALDLLTAAETYGIDRLSVMCQRVIEKKISTYNVGAYLSMCEKYGLDNLKERCIDYAVHHLKQVQNSRSYKRNVSWEMRGYLKLRRKELKENDTFDTAYAQQNHGHTKFSRRRTTKRERANKRRKQMKRLGVKIHSEPVEAQLHKPRANAILANYDYQSKSQTSSYGSSSRESFIKESSDMGSPRTRLGGRSRTFRKNKQKPNLLDEYLDDEFNPSPCTPTSSPSCSPYSETFIGVGMEEF